MERYVEIDTGSMEPAQAGDDLFWNRSAAIHSQQTGAPDVTVIVIAYNRLEKTRRCVESLLENTTGVNYELILIDNGSTDGTLEYFQAVAFDRKVIIRVTHNIGAFYPECNIPLQKLGRFVCLLTNDLILTPRWLENLLACMESNSRIGMVNPVSSNVSNYQEVHLPDHDYEEMRKAAGAFNRSDPRKWEDRLRLITLGTVYRKEALLAVGWPYFDAGFFNDFADDDITFRIRRAGYRTVLAGDTWICHDHDFRHGEGKDLAEFQRSLQIGRQNFRDKYFGVDAWDDVNNFYLPYLSHFPAPSGIGRASVLGVDTRCGTPILDIGNWLRKYGVFETELSAFTQDPKYWLDLKTICAGPVVCDREEFLRDSFPPEGFDYIVADRPLNQYHEPEKMLRDLFSLCKKGGYVVCWLTNAFSFREYLHLLGQTDVYAPEFSYNIPRECFRAALERYGEVRVELRLNAGVDEDGQKALSSLYPAGLPEGQKAKALEQMQCQAYLFVVRKKQYEDGPAK